MSKPNLAAILDDCLQRLQAGATVDDCLTHHAAQAAELAPMLAAAVQLQALATYHLSDAQKLRARVALRETLATQSQPHTWLPRGLGLGRVRGLALSGVAALLLFAALTISAVASSQPGDLGYLLRVVIERAPALVQRAPAGRAAVEVTVAERRLGELQHHVETAGQASITALNALLAGDRAAADQASGLSEPKRVEIAARVTQHANALTELAQAATEPRTASALQTAAAEALAIAMRLQAGPPTPAAPPVTRPTFTPTETRDATPAPGETALPRPTRTPEARSAGPRPASATPTRVRTRLAPAPTGAPPWRAQFGSQTPQPGRRATAIVQTITALPTRPPRPTATPTPDRTPAGPGLPPLPPDPDHRATVIVQTATALPAWIETRRAEHTPQTPTRPMPTATPSPKHGARATEIALTVTALPGFMPPPPTRTRTPWAGPPSLRTPTTRPTRTPTPPATEPGSQPTRSTALASPTPTTRPTRTPAPYPTETGARPTQTAAAATDTPTARPTHTPTPRPTDTASPRPTLPVPGPGATAQAATHTPQPPRTPGTRG